MKDLTTQWFNDRGWTPLSYQPRIINGILNSESKKIVMAASPCSGKTVMSIAIIDLMKRKNPNLRVLVLTHNTVVIRENFMDEWENLGKPFDCQEIVDSKQVFNEDIVVALPATLNYYDELPKFDIVFVDEAHHYYDKKQKKNKQDISTVKKIIEKVGATTRILMTGTPSPFNGKSEFDIHYVTLREVIESGNCSDIRPEIVTSRYFTRDDDYTQDENIKTSYNFKKKETEMSLDSVMEEIQKRLESKFRNVKKYKYSKFVDWARFKKEIGRTIIACQDGTQAKQVKEYFDNKGVPAVLSISEVDDNTMLKEFKRNKDYKVLIVVFRGVLGYSDKTIVNVVDMTLSRNIDRMFQLFNRGTRKWYDYIKLFIKLVPENAVGRYTAVTAGMLCMMDEEWYTKFNGKNFYEMRVPIYKKRQRTQRGTGEGGTKDRPEPIEDLNIIPPSELFEYLKSSNTTKVFNPAYTTTLRTVLNRLHKIKGKNFTNTIEMINEFYEKNAGAYIPTLNKDLTKKSIINRAKRLGIHNELVEKHNMREFKGKPDGHWKDINNVLQLAWTCDNAVELKTKSSAAWKTANDHGLLYLPKPEGCGFTKTKLSYDPDFITQLIEEAERQGKTLNQLNPSANNAYRKFKKRGIMQ